MAGPPPAKKPKTGATDEPTPGSKSPSDEAPPNNPASDSETAEAGAGSVKKRKRKAGGEAQQEKEAKAAAKAAAAKAKHENDRLAKWSDQAPYIRYTAVPLDPKTDLFGSYKTFTRIDDKGELSRLPADKSINDTPARNLQKLAGTLGLHNTLTLHKEILSNADILKVNRDLDVLFAAGFYRKSIGPVDISMNATRLAGFLQGDLAKNWLPYLRDATARQFEWNKTTVAELMAIEPSTIPNSDQLACLSLGWACYRLFRLLPDIFPTMTKLMKEGSSKIDYDECCIAKLILEGVKYNLTHSTAAKGGTKQNKQAFVMWKYDATIPADKDEYLKVTTAQQTTLEKREKTATFSQTYFNVDPIQSQMRDAFKKIAAAGDADDPDDSEEHMQGQAQLLGSVLSANRKVRKLPAEQVSGVLRQIVLNDPSIFGPGCPEHIRDPDVEFDPQPVAPKNDATFLRGLRNARHIQNVASDAASNPQGAAHAALSQPDILPIPRQASIPLPYSNDVRDRYWNGKEYELGERNGHKLFLLPHQWQAVGRVLDLLHGLAKTDDELAEEDAHLRLPNPNHEGDDYKLWAPRLAGVLLSHSCGMGKTIMALSAADMWTQHVVEHPVPNQRYTPTLIVFPAQALNVWRDEISANFRKKFKGVFILAGDEAIDHSTLGTMMTNHEFCHALFVPGGKFDPTNPDTARKLVLVTHTTWGKRSTMNLKAATEAKIKLAEELKDPESDASKIPGINKIEDPRRRLDYALAYQNAGVFSGHIPRRNGPKSTQSSDEEMLEEQEGCLNNYVLFQGEQMDPNSDEYKALKKKQDEMIDVIVATSPEDVISLFANKFLLVIVDEGHYLKNRRSQTNLGVRLLNPDFTLALSATPLVNLCIDFLAYLELFAGRVPYKPFLPPGLELSKLDIDSLTEEIYHNPDVNPNLFASPDIYRAALVKNKLNPKAAFIMLSAIQSTVQIRAELGDKAYMSEDEYTIIGADIPPMRVWTCPLRPNLTERQETAKAWKKYAPNLTGGTAGDKRAKKRSRYDGDVTGSINLAASGSLQQAAYCGRTPLVSRLIANRDEEGVLDAKLAKVLETSAADDGGLTVLLSALMADSPHLLPSHVASDPGSTIDYMSRFSAKSVWLASIIRRHVLLRGEKLVIMCEWPLTCFQVENFITPMGIPFHFIHSDMKMDERAPIIQDWNKPDSKFRILVSNSRLIGTGQNLHIACNTMAFVEAPVNWAQMLQGMGRIIRIAQQLMQFIYIAYNAYSWDEKIFHRNCSKYLPHCLSFGSKTRDDFVKQYQVDPEDMDSVRSDDRRLILMAYDIMSHMFGFPPELGLEDPEKIKQSMADIGIDENGRILTPLQRLQSHCRLKVVGTPMHYYLSLLDPLTPEESTMIVKKVKEEIFEKKTHKAASRLWAKVGPALADPQSVRQGLLDYQAAWAATTKPATEKQTKLNLRGVNAGQKPIATCINSLIHDHEYIEVGPNRSCEECAQLQDPNPMCFRPCRDHYHDFLAGAKKVFVSKTEGATFNPATFGKDARKFDNSTEILEELSQLVPPLCDDCEDCHPAPADDDQDVPMTDEAKKDVAESCNHELAEVRIRLRKQEDKANKAKEKLAVKGVFKPAKMGNSTRNKKFNGRTVFVRTKKRVTMDAEVTIQEGTLKGCEGRIAKYTKKVEDLEAKIAETLKDTPYTITDLQSYEDADDDQVPSDSEPDNDFPPLGTGALDGSDTAAGAGEGEAEGEGGDKDGDEDGDEDEGGDEGDDGDEGEGED